MKSPQYCYEYPRPALTVDMVVWGYGQGQFHILLIQRKDEPFKNKWALPGGFVEDNETAEEAVHRELKEETDLENKSLNQLYTVSELNRDPRGRTVSVIFYTLCHRDRVNPSAGDDAKNVKWYPIDDLPALAFDHAEVIMKAESHLRDLACHLKIGPQFIQEPFVSNDIIDCYNAIINGFGKKAFEIFKSKKCILTDPDDNNKYLFDLKNLQELWNGGLLFYN